MNDSEAGASASAWEDFDVFLNYREYSDVKATFVSHLEEALRCAGFRPFLDAHSLNMKGISIFESTDRALEMAKVHVAVVSKGHAESKHCLNELVAMMRSGKPVIPVFYDVDPRDLQWVENGPFAKAFERHRQKEKPEKVQEWTESLKALASVKGFGKYRDFQRDEAKLKREVVNEVARLRHINPPVEVDNVGDGDTKDFDVFLSHRGKDMPGFVSHLEEALRCAGFRPCLGTDSRMNGIPALEPIFEALEMAKVHVAVVSKGYAESKYCLNELVAMMRSGKTVIPVFYDVEPIDLRWVENGPFKQAFEKHRLKRQPEKVQEWLESLIALSELTGFSLDDFQRDEAKLKRELVNEVARLTPVNRPVEVDRFKGGTIKEEKISQLLGCMTVDAMFETLVLNAAKECAEEVQNLMQKLKFNNEQCKYLADKLQSVVATAASLLSELQTQKCHGPCSSADMAKLVDISDFLVGLSKQIEIFVRDCSSDKWIQAAMTYANVAEYALLLGFNLELCELSFKKESSTLTRSQLLDQVDKIHKAEAAIVETKAFTDVANLLAKVTLAMNHLPNEERALAGYLRQRLTRVQPLQTSWRDSTLSSCGIFEVMEKLFQWVISAEQLGTGSSATVFKAAWLGIPVAKKRFPIPEDPEFVKEVEILSKLSHPNVTSMFCYTKDKRSCSIIMELMDEDLDALIQRRLATDGDSPPFTILEAVDIMLQVGEGVRYLHDMRIVHRDLKGKNILVKGARGTKQGAKYVHAKVTDFGLSKLKETSVRYSHQTFNTGTCRWMAPELINLYNVDGELVNKTKRVKKVERYPFKCDVYSFGMLCYEILSGYVPFSTIGSSKTVKEKVLKGERPNLPNHCPLELKALIEKCWNQEPSERPRFATICLELKILKCLLMTSFIQGLGHNHNQGTIGSSEKQMSTKTRKRKTEGEETEARKNISTG
ncbi:hypothetical protein KC19_3G096300 [Ceratodon purpureus]|uniref:Uncharacterized protein n=1 Tax=Ceratodon purpureus TaxID=3225 RepID=A0A8T0IK70_CERPU|nr:hypothetical protein KC19_3G096300 [Ceratodon purpureus]